MSTVVCKFGGSSMATAESVKLVSGIVTSDICRKYVVVSAPGKSHKTDIKVTDLLYKCADEVKKTGDCPSFELIRDKYISISNGLGLNININEKLNEVKSQIISINTPDFAASRGEYLSAYILSKYLKYTFVDATELIRFDSNGVYDSEATNACAYTKLRNIKYCVIPGFYGMMENGEIKTFSRGGSDITGAIVARAIVADLYENWTDVNGFMTCDPNIVSDAEQMYCLSYKELRELSYMGASVLHSESIFPVSASAIPINIKNTFNASNAGTMIVPNLAYISNDGRPITGIAGKKDFTVIHIEKDLMNNEMGFSRKVLSVLEKFNISYEHMPTGIDTISLVVSSKQLDSCLQDVINGIELAVQPDMIEVIDNMALIATVGRNMINNRDVASRLFSALEKSNVVVRMIDQGSSGLNIIIGVNNRDYETAIKSIYYEFIK